MISSDIVQNDPGTMYTQYKCIEPNTIIYQPLIKDPYLSSIGVYYTISDEKKYVAKCFDRKTFTVIEGMEDAFLILMGDQAKVIVTSNNRYYLSPYYNSGTIADLFKKQIKFKHDRLVQFLVQIAGHLAALHKKGYYHGELTPDHILVNTEEDGSLKFGICGFGHYIKKSKEYYKRSDVTPYLDVRVLDNPNEKHNGSCDIWSLGIITYRLATGKLQDIEDIKEYLTDQDGDEISVILKYFILRCISSDPRERIHAKNIIYQPFFIPLTKEITNYTITDKKLGSGASSIVKLARLKNDLNRKYAVKILNPLNNQIDAKKMLLLGEISILMMIKDSPYIIKLDDYFEYDGKVHLVLEFCNGGDLEGYLKEEKEHLELAATFMLQEVKVISYYLAKAIELLYNKNIVHRDIKPKNLLISIDKKTKRIAKVKLSDFGLSRELSSKDVKMGSLIGTPKYVAPEVLSSDYTIKMDVWCYGVILYYLAYGILPSDYGGSHSINSSKSIKYPPKPRFGLPDSFVQLIKGCLTYAPSNRFNITDVINHRYFTSDSTAVFTKIPSCYSFSPRKPLVDNTVYTVREIIYNSTKAKLLMKILKGPISKKDQERIKKDVNTLLVLRGCPDIYKFHHSFIVGNNYYFILDHCRGETLQDYVTNKTGMTMKEIKTIGIAIATAINDNYERNIKHGKITPSNIYICHEESKDGLPRVKLAGYSHLVQNINDTNLKMEVRDDIDSFGEILYFLLFKTIKGYRTNSTLTTVGSIEGFTASTYDTAHALSIVKRCESEYYKTPVNILKERFFVSNEV